MARRPPVTTKAAAIDRVVLVTGAADRIGATISKTLAEAGWKVVIHHRGGVEKAREVQQAIIDAGGNAELVKADLADRAQRGRLIAEAGKPFGPLTALINNASSFAPDAVADLDEKLWDSHFAVHAEAPVFLARDFAAQLPEGAEGNVVNMIDERVLHLSPDYFSYTLSKSVLWAATRTLAQSLAPAIRVNAIGPGPTLPHEGQSEASFRHSTERLPLQRGPLPHDIAQGVLYILSARALTGQMLTLDGGEHLQWLPHSGPTPRTK